MNQVERIAYHEDLMNQVQRALDQFEAGMEAFAAAGEKVTKLSAYLGSDEWKKDLEDDEAGRLPAGLRRGVLSEDGIYNMEKRYRELLERAEELFGEDGRAL